MNFKKIYEEAIKYQKGNDGPFGELDNSIKSAKTQKPAVKGTPHFKVEKAAEPPTNKPSCPVKNDTYNVRYSKCGCLTEQEFNEVKNILRESEWVEEEEYEVDPDEFDDIYDEYEPVDEEALEDEELMDYDTWKNFGDEVTDEEIENFDKGIEDDEHVIEEDVLFDEDGDVIEDEEFLTDDEYNSGLGKMNRGEDVFN